jgi:O-antigen/teichoic acid export membrane protein
MTDDSRTPEELRRATAQGVRWTLLARPASEIVLILSMIVLARLVSPADFGRYAVVSATVGISVVPGQAIVAGVIQCRSLERRHVQSAMAIALIVALGLSALLLIAAPLVMSPIFDARTAMLVQLAVPICFVTTACSVPSALLQRRLEFRRIAVISVVSNVVDGLAAVALAAVGLQGASLVLGDVAAAAASGALFFWWARTPLPRVWRAETRQLLSYSTPALLTGLSWFGFENCDYAIIGARVGPLAAGLYFRAYSTGVKYQAKVSQVMYQIAFPVLSRMKSTDDLNALRGEMTQILMLVLLPLLTLLAVTAPVLIPWIYGGQWRPAVVPTQILAIAGVANLIISTLLVAIQADRRNWTITAYSWGNFVCYAAAVFATARHGIVAVAIAAAVTHTAFLFIGYLLLCRGKLTQAIMTLARDLFPATACAAAFATAALAVSKAMDGAVPVVPYIASVSVAGGVAYLAAMRIGFPSSWRMLRSVAKRLVPQRIRRGLTPHLEFESAAR